MWSIELESDIFLVMRDQLRKLAIFLFWGMLIFILNNSWGDHPALGRILNPFTGVWQNGIVKKDFNLELKPLQSKVHVQWDEHAVPHIFAENNWDLYFVQGYLHAKDRLFQMDLAARAGSGRLSEVVGDKTLEMDKYFVRIGMREGARKATEGFLKDKLTQQAVDAYVAGINTYINSLNYKDYPVEYKLLNVRPELFTPLHVGQFLKIMSFRLAGKSFDLELTKLLKRMGREKLWDLFPPYQRDPSFIISENDLPISLRNKPEVFEENFISVFADYKSYLNKLYSPNGEGEGFNGSNNWAVHKSKSQTGYNLLANDTHLAFTLPSVWYEMQLMNDNSNVYGASFPGAPGIIVGYNQDVAWAVTNATMDTMDFYEVEFRKDYTEYLHKGAWKKVKVIVEEIPVKLGETRKIRTLWTHQGVVVDKKENKGLVLAWTAHQESAELEALLNLNRSKNIESCRKELKKYQAPAQNFICTDRESISITHNGRVPSRKLGQGRYIMSTATPNNEWQEYVNFEELPTAFNPKKGFVSSANQVAVGPNYKHYLGWYYDDSYRGQRIHDVLSQEKKFTVKDMMALQNDVKDKMVEQALPLMIKNLDFTSLNEKQNSLITELKNWDYLILHDSYLPSLFYVWWKNLKVAIWQDQLLPEKGGPPLFPQASRTIDLMRDLTDFSQPKDLWNEVWVDDETTPNKKETLKEIVTASFLNMWHELTDRFGEFSNGSEAWNWENINKLNIRHVAKIPGFNGREYKLNGSLKTVAANTGTHGASWKMLVELGPELDAWTNVPGGVSGNPFDPTYQLWLESWTQGKMRKVHFWKEPQSSEGIKSVEWGPKK